jgi:hypothetical protein
MQGDEAKKMAERVQSRRLKRLHALNLSVNSSRVFASMGSDKRVRPQRNSDVDLDKVWSRSTHCLPTRGLMSHRLNSQGSIVDTDAELKMSFVDSLRKPLNKLTTTQELLLGRHLYVLHVTADYLLC